MLTTLRKRDPFGLNAITNNRDNDRKTVEV